VVKNLKVVSLKQTVFNKNVFNSFCFFLFFVRSTPKLLLIFTSVRRGFESTFWVVLLSAYNSRRNVGAFPTWRGVDSSLTGLFFILMVFCCIFPSIIVSRSPTFLSTFQAQVYGLLMAACEEFFFASRV